MGTEDIRRSQDLGLRYHSQGGALYGVHSPPPVARAEIQHGWRFIALLSDGREVTVVPCWETLLEIYPLEFAGKLSSRKAILKEMSHWRHSTAICSQRGCQATCWPRGAAGHHALQEPHEGEASGTVGACLKSTAEAGSRPLLLLESLSIALCCIGAGW